MFKNYFRLAWRQLKKNKGFATINLLGLTLGLATTLLIVGYVNDELGYDRYNSKAGRIFRVNTDLRSPAEFTFLADAAPPVAGILTHNYPEVAAAVRILPNHGMRFRKGSLEMDEPRVATVDPAIFDIFTLPMLEGDPGTALNSPHTVVITESTAKKYFNSTHVIGRTLTEVDDTSFHTITGVIRDMPAQSSFHYDLLLTQRGGGIEKNNSLYAMYPMSTFILLKPGADEKALDKKLGDFMKTWDENYKKMDTNYSSRLGLTPLTDIHLRSNRADELEANGSIQYIYIFSAIAVFVLLIAAINFMNLSTAHSVNRAREVGVRKVLGSDRGQLIVRFLSESLFLTMAATIAAVALAGLLLPWFNQLTGKDLSVTGAALRWLLPSLLGITLIVGALSGVYPAFFLSSFRAIDVLKGKSSAGATGGNGASLRSILVVFQFAISVFLIVGTLVVNSQLRYIQNKDIGFSRDQVLTVKGMDALANPLTLKKEIRALPGVADATITAFLPTSGHRWHNWGYSEAIHDNLKTELWEVDADYIPTMGMHLVTGRNFIGDNKTDSNAIILNETAAKKYGIAANALNRDIFYPYYRKPTHFKVVGVVRDFNYSTLRTNVDPLVMVQGQDYDPSLSIRVQAGSLPAVLGQVRAMYTARAPQRPFQYSFMDEDFDALYRSEQRMGKVVLVLTGLALLIACLGLFALAAFAAEQRTKEIGIRKVLGAGVPGIIGLLTKEFLRLVILGVVIAAPLAWFGMHRWLQSFAYRTTIDGWPFAAAAGFVLLIAFLTTFFQSFKAATANPVKKASAPNEYPGRGIPRAVDPPGSGSPRTTLPVA